MIPTLTPTLDASADENGIRAAIARQKMYFFMDSSFRARTNSRLSAHALIMFSSFAENASQLKWFTGR